MPYECTAGASAGACLNEVALYSTGSALMETTYNYDSDMDGKKMHFDTDCSCWAGYVLDSYYGAAFALITNDTTVKPAVPRAAQFYDYLAAPSGPWSTVADIRTVQVSLFALLPPPFFRVSPWYRKGRRYQERPHHCTSRFPPRPTSCAGG